MTRALGSLKNLHFNEILLTKVYVWAKKVQASYLSWHWRVTQKLTCGLENDIRDLADFPQSTRKSQNWDFDGIFLSKVENVWLKIYRGVMCHDNEVWCKIQRGMTCQFKIDEEFDEFWPEHSKISKICTLTGGFWPKYMFELKKYRGVMFDGTEDWWFFKKEWKRILYFWQALESLRKFTIKLHVLQCLFVRASNKKQRRGRIISNFTKGETFSSLMTTKCSWA